MIQNRIQEPDRAQKGSKMKVLRIRTKPIPLRPTRHADSGHIFTFSNGLRMRELSHSDQISQTTKKSKKKINSQKVTWHSLEVTHGSGRSDMWKHRQQGDWVVTRTNEALKSGS
jgi:hypothetical protein